MSLDHPAYCVFSTVGNILNTVGNMLSTLRGFLGTVEYVQYHGHPSPSTEHIFYRVKISVENIQGFFHEGASVSRRYKMAVQNSGGLS